MAYDSNAARAEMLTDIGAAVDELSAALAGLGAAYELLDDASADRLEEGLFGPVQHAYGLAKRTHGEFAERRGLPPTSFAAAEPGHPSQGASGFIAGALDAVARADLQLSELQDSMRPVEVGDEELRAGLAEVRRLLADVPAHARELTRTLGR